MILYNGNISRLKKTFSCPVREFREEKTPLIENISFFCKSISRQVKIFLFPVYFVLSENI